MACFLGGPKWWPSCESPLFRLAASRTRLWRGVCETILVPLFQVTSNLPWTHCLCFSSKCFWRTVQIISFKITCSLSVVAQYVIISVLLLISIAIFLCVTHCETLINRASNFNLRDCLNHISFPTEIVPREFWPSLTFWYTAFTGWHTLQFVNTALSTNTGQICGLP